ncbi:MAG: transcriptional regulator [Spirochaetaceae bacterium]|nr:transcriptional regulator [Spirochaetaceae bacterium]
MDNVIETNIEDDFNKARNKAFINEMQHLLSPEKTNLMSLADVKKMLKPQNEVYLGIKVVPLKNIVGSEGRYKDFDNHFFPRNQHLKHRWEQVDKAHINDIILPPVVLYEIGGLYFVRDGNHRVSVARLQGVENIDAEVISLQSEIKLKPSYTKEEILKQVLAYEKRVFYSETNFGDITDYWDMDFSTTGQYDVIYQHIQIHKYFINQDQKEEIPLPDAIMSWFKNVYVPVINVIQEQHILRKFHHRTVSDMYVWITKYWDDIKQKTNKNIEIKDAAKQFTEKYGQRTFQKVLDRLKFLLKS